jgi:CubicO group peptidase (beta-lactamase class C family)
MLRRLFLQFSLALRKDRLDKVEAILKEATDSGAITSASALVRQGKDEHRWVAGKTRAAEPVYLLASITKPMTVAGVMVLADRGEVKLNDPVKKYLPEFQGDGRDAVLVRHLLTHTSGLPDMLPENEALRKRHAPLSEFVAGACRVPLLFAPGTQCKYQSMGILLAAEIAERITKMKLRDWLRKSVFDPLGMKSTALGLGQHKIPDTEQCQVPVRSDWDWNSPYWRDFGAPWGGAHSNAPDVLRFIDSFLAPNGAAIKRDTARAMVTNQNTGLNEPWGLGLMVNGASFGKACSAGTFGHWGSTGTVCWADPKSGIRLVLLTTKPAGESRASVLGPVSDAVAEAAA